MVAVPAEALVAVERAAAIVAQELGLAERWFNSDVQLRRDALDSGWHSRKVLVGQFGRLRVFAASRLDLIAVKVLAGRAQDIQDLAPFMHGLARPAGDPGSGWVGRPSTYRTRYAFVATNASRAGLAALAQSADSGWR